MIVAFIWRIVAIIQSLDNKQQTNVSPFDAILIGLSLIILIPTLLGVMCLCGYQMQLISENITSIEAYTKDIEQRKAKKKGKPYRFPYDLGFRHNIAFVFGDHWCNYLVPSIPRDDGLHYEVHKGIDV